MWREAAWKSKAGFVFEPAALSIENIDYEQAYAELDRRWSRGGFPEYRVRL